MKTPEKTPGINPTDVRGARARAASLETMAEDNNKSPDEIARDQRLLRARTEQDEKRKREEAERGINPEMLLAMMGDGAAVAKAATPIARQTTYTKINKIANRQAQMKKWEEMAEHKNPLKRGYAESRLAIARKQDWVAAKIKSRFGGITEKMDKAAGRVNRGLAGIGEKFRNFGGRTVKFFKPAAKLEKDVAEAGKMAKFLKPMVKVAKFLKPAAKIAKWVGLVAVAAGGAAAIGAASPVIAVIGTVAFVAVAGMGVAAAYSSFRATGSITKAAIEGVDASGLPLKACIDVVHGNLTQAAADGAESAIGMGGGEAAQLARTGLNLMHRGGQAAAVVSTAQTAIAVKELADKNPVLAKKVEGAMWAAAVKSPGEIVKVTGDIARAQHGGKADALVTAVITDTDLVPRLVGGKPPLRTAAMTPDAVAGKNRIPAPRHGNQTAVPTDI